MNTSLQITFSATQLIVNTILKMENRMSIIIIIITTIISLLGPTHSAPDADSKSLEKQKNKASDHLSIIIKFYKDTLTLMDRVEHSIKDDPFEAYRKESEQQIGKIRQLKSRMDDYLKELKSKGPDSEEESEKFFQSIHSEFDTINNVLDDVAKPFEEPSKDLEAMDKDHKDLVEKMEELHSRESIFDESLTLLESLYGIHLKEPLPVEPKDFDSFDLNLLLKLSESFLKLEEHQQMQKESGSVDDIKIKKVEQEISEFIKTNQVKLRQFLSIIKLKRQGTGDLVNNIDKMDEETGEKLVETSLQLLEVTKEAEEFIETAKSLRKTIIVSFKRKAHGGEF